MSPIENKIAWFARRRAMKKLLPFLVILFGTAAIAAQPLGQNVKRSGDTMTGPLHAVISPLSGDDSTEANNSIYFSTTINKLVYKTAHGTVEALY